MAVDAGAFDDAAIMELSPPAYVGEEAYRNKGDRMRKLLEEAAKVLAQAHNHLMELTAKLPMQYFGLVDSGIIQDSDNLIARITAALSAPEPDAKAILRQVVAIYRKADEDAASREIGVGAEDAIYEKADSEAAALIESHRKRVPRAMLEEIFDNGYQAGDEFGAYDDIDPARKDFDAIAEKFGYRAE